jgi:GrpB-like predicted nucleotidyltransferase (UPF0157 family)
MSSSRVEIHDYQDAWVREFRDLGDALRQALGGTAVRIDHIGSTSIPGLAAKPIIDVQVSVIALEPMDLYLGRIESLGEERAAGTSSMRCFFGTTCESTLMRATDTSRSSEN